MKFKELLDKAYKKFKTSNTNVVFQYTISIDMKIESLLNTTVIKKDMFYMKFPNNDTAYLGLGKIISHRITSKSELHNLTEKKYSTINNKNQKLSFFGGLAFNLDDENFYPWENTPKGEFYIPKILIKQNKQKTEFTYSKLINNSIQKRSILNDYKNMLSMLNKSKLKNEPIPKIKFKSEDPNQNNYIQHINSLIKKINKGQLQKIVISRLVKYSLKSRLSINKLIEYFNKQYANCFNFFICFNKNNIFTGSTPERLIKLENNLFEIDAIAGSSKRINELKSKKEIIEHKHVTKHIYKTMSKISSKLSQPKKPEILQLKYINHLSTTISGILRQKMHIINILSSLYPTPALLGNSSKVALKYIKKTEKTDRGWYAGAIGMYDENGNGQFYVPIRSGLIKNKLLLLFTGSGIVSKSNAEKEWNETVLKLDHFLSYFNKTNLK